MSKTIALTLAFLDQEPGAAAQELQLLDLEVCAALLESVPTRLCLKVLSSMIPWHAARILEWIDPGKAAAILRRLSFAESVTLTRLITPDKREYLIDAMPSRYARRLRSALEYPLHQVGAWIDPDVPTLSAEDTVHDALRVLQSADGASHVFLESADHATFLGLIAVRDILRADRSTKLDRLRRVDSEPLSNRTPISSLIVDERWDDLLHLPVIGRRGNLLGGLSRGTLRHATHEQAYAGVKSQGSILRAVLEALSVVAAGILKLAVANSHSSAYGGSGNAR